MSEIKTEAELSELLASLGDSLEQVATDNELGLKAAAGGYVLAAVLDAMENDREVFGVLEGLSDNRLKDNILELATIIALGSQAAVITALLETVDTESNV